MRSMWIRRLPAKANRRRSIYLHLRTWRLYSLIARQRVTKPSTKVKR